MGTIFRSIHGRVLIRGGCVIDPVSGAHEVKDLYLADGRISDAAVGDATILDAQGFLVCPGFTDLHVHLREPGQSYKETIESGTAAAAAGGFTAVACMPNTNPAIDTPETVRWITEKSNRAGFCDVRPVAAITQGRQGRTLTEFKRLLEAGAAAFSDDGTGVEDDGVMRLAFETAARLDALLIQHCEYRSISAGGVMHKGTVSDRLGLRGIDPRSEEAMIERDIDLCRRTGGRYHVAHISTARAVELVRRAKAEGLPITAEVTPHHLVLTDEACSGLDPNTKMHPPLRTAEDVRACRRGLLDGTIDCIATDHAPHAAKEKAEGFLKAPPGVVGLETALGVSAWALLESGLEPFPAEDDNMPALRGGHGTRPGGHGTLGEWDGSVASWFSLIRWFTTGPARVLRRPPPVLEVGAPGDLTIIDPNRKWRVDPEQFHSKGRNTSFAGWELKGRVVTTVRTAQGAGVVCKARIE